MRESTEKLLEELKKYPVFDLLKVARKVKTGDGYLRLFIHRLVQKKALILVERNKYTMYKDPWIVASHIVWPSYISSWAALQYHNFTDQLPTMLEVVTSKKRRKRELSFHETKIKIITTKPALMFGFTKGMHEGMEIFIAEPEKALLDAALFKSMSFSEIKDIVVAHFSQLKKERLVAYLLKIGNKSLIKRFGYLLDQTGKDYYNRLHHHVDHNFISLDYALPQKGDKNAKWRIIDNVTKR